MISCEKHDYIEIACLFRLTVLMTLKNGEQLTGKAWDTRLTSNKEESLILLQENGEHKELLLSQLQNMRAITQNPHFEQIDLN